MNLKEIIKCLLQALLKNHKASFHKLLKTKFKFVYDWIVKRTPKLTDNFSIGTRVCWILNDYVDFPKCKTDGEYIEIWKHKNIPATHKYPKYCKKHAHNNPEAVKHIKDTLATFSDERKKEINDKRVNYCLTEYGCENVSQIPEVIDKITNSISAHYGVKRYSQTPEWKEETIRANNENFGVNWYSQSEQFLSATSKTIKMRYGEQYSSVFQLDFVKEKISQTKNEKHDDPNYNNRPQFLETLSARYGTTNLFSLPDYRKKMHAYYEYDGEKFQSSAELAFYIWLKEHNIQFQYQPEDKVIPYIDALGKNHLYFPDFYLIDSNEIVEIKGDNHFNKVTGKLINITNRQLDYIAEAKYDAMIQHGVKIIKQSQMKDIFKYITETKGENFKRFLKRFRVK